MGTQVTEVCNVESCSKHTQAEVDDYNRRTAEFELSKLKLADVIINACKKHGAARVARIYLSLNMANKHSWMLCDGKFFGGVVGVDAGLAEGQILLELEHE